MSTRQYTFEDLGKKTVAQLKEIAEGVEHEALRGYKSMRKDTLLLSLCEALGVDTREHHTVVGIDKSGIKANIHKLKAERDEALKAHNHKQLKLIRRKIHRLKRKIRKATK